MSKLLQISQLGHPILRKKTPEIKKIDDPVLQELIDDMIMTVLDVDGVGIAAPQVYATQRVFIIASHPNARYPQAPEMEPTAIINPKIIKASKELVKDWEGCLSIPGVRALVPRHKKIEVEYFNRSGKKVFMEFEDFVARVFQHELDHLDGLVFFDRLETPKDIYMEKEYQKILAKK